jgi:hypothetical protein
MAILIKDHEGLQDTVGRAILGMGAAGILGMFVSPPLGAAFSALAAGLAMGIPKSTSSVLVVVTAAIVAGLGRWLGPTAGVMIGSVAVGLAAARDLPSNPRRATAATFVAMGWATAAMVQAAFGLTGILHFMPNGIEALIAGAAGGLVLGVSALGRHIEMAGEQVALVADDSEIGQLLRRAEGAYKDAVAALAGDVPQARTAADDLMAKMARFGRRWSEVERESARTSPETLRQRIAELDQRLLNAADPMARTDFERANESLKAQLRYLDDIARGRDRAVARLTHQVAILERLRLAAIRHRSLDATRLGSELQPMVDELTDAGGDLDVAAEALDEATTAALPPASAS